MEINCPYCETSYDLNDSLLPERGIKAKCRVCLNIFNLDKKTGASKAELPFAGPFAASPAKVDETQAAEGTAGTPGEDFSLDVGAVSIEPPSDDFFMQSVTAEIKEAIAEEIHKQKQGGNAAAGSKKNPASREKSLKKRKQASFQLLPFIVLILLLLILAGAVLVYYHIINIPFLPPNPLAFLGDKFLGGASYVFSHIKQRVL